MKTSVNQSSKSAVLYVRVSSKEQEKEGFSIPAQLKLLKEYAVANGFRLEREFADIETAKQSGREGFGKMLDYLKKNPTCRTVLVEKTDRLYRNFKDYVTLEGLKIEIHLVKEGTVISDGSRSSEKFIHGIKVLMAKNYIDNLSEEASKGMRQKAEEGMWPSIAPIGYKNVQGPNGKKIIVPDPQAAPLIMRLFREYATGQYSLKVITKMLKDEGLVFRKSQKPIPRSTVHVILKNRVYTGEFEWNGKTYQGKYESLISMELWLKAQDVLEKRYSSKTRQGKNAFTYSGLLTCGHCGCALVGEMKKSKYTYYHCTGYKGKCPEPYTREENLDNQIADNLKKLSLDDEVLEWMKTALRQSHRDEIRFRNETFQRLNDELTRVQKRLDTLYDDKTDGRIDETFFDAKAKKYRREQDRLLAEIKKYQRVDKGYKEKGIELLDMAHTAHTDFKARNSVEKRRLLAFFVETGSWKGGVLEPRFKQPFDLLAVSNSQDPIKKPSEVGSEGFNRKWLPIFDAYRTLFSTNFLEFKQVFDFFQSLSWTKYFGSAINPSR